jgi:hypothetical protein
MNTSDVIKHIGYNTDPYLLTGYCVVNISWEYIYKVTIIIKKVQKIYIHKVTRSSSLKHITWITKSNAANNQWITSYKTVFINYMTT